MLYDVRVVKLPKHLDLSLHLFKHSLLLDLLLIKNFDGHLVSGNLVKGHYRANRLRKTSLTFDFAKGADSEVFRESVVANFNVKSHD